MKYKKIQKSKDKTRNTTYIRQSAADKIQKQKTEYNR